jgi:hypothetical protein
MRSLVAIGIHHYDDIVAVSHQLRQYPGDADVVVGMGTEDHDSLPCPFFQPIFLIAHILAPLPKPES